MTDMEIERFPELELREQPIGFLRHERPLDIERSVEAYESPGTGDLNATGGPREIYVPPWWGAVA